MLGLTHLLSLSFLSLLIYKAFSLFQNIRLAKSTGLPYTLSIFHEFEVWTYLTDPFIRWKYSKYLMRGEGWPKWARFMVKDWMYEDKARAHQELGDVFLVATPGGLVCYVADAKTAMTVCTRRKDFIKPPEKMKMIEPFGPNIVSTQGDVWRLHLKITLPPFGDSVNRLVWAETLRQTNLLASAWSIHASDNLKIDTYNLTLKVMIYAAFGQQSDWTDGSSALPPSHKLSLLNSIYGVVLFLPHILLLPKWALKRSPWSNAYTAYNEFETYIHEFLDAEKSRLARDKTYESKVKGNLLTAILKSNAESKDEALDEKGRRTTLSDREILGNAFMFLLAGYDTTANTIIFSSIILSLYGEIQDKMIEEIDRIYTEAEKAGRKELSFDEDLPKFKYVLAFMYEIMRVFPIVIPIGRIITQPHELVVETSTPDGGGRTSTTHMLPSGTGVIVNNTGIHFNHHYWPHPSIIEPLRWLSANPNTYDPTSSTPPDANQAPANFPGHMKGTFLTFSEGPRACLGKRFAQVEFVAFFARLLRLYRIGLAPGLDKIVVEKTVRLRSGGSPVTLMPPEDVKLSLVARKH